MKTVVVLGAGLAGLSTSWKLADEGFNVIVIEKDNQVGGLAKTLHRKNYFCDLGPHRFITRSKYLIQEIESLVGKNLLLHRQRKSKILIQGRYIEYPPNLKDVFLNFNLSVSFKVVIDYFITFIRNKIRPRPDDSFKSWAINRFGRTFYNIYFRDYTAKLWRIPPSSISADWATQRISVVNLADVLKRLFLKKKKVPRTYVNKFYYPINGIGAIATKMAERIRSKGSKICLDSQIEKITVESGTIKSITFNKDREKTINIKADYIVSTIPVGNLACMITDNSLIINAASNLKTMPLIYLFLLIKKTRISNNHWFYFPEKKYTFNRISEIKNFSPEMVPAGKTVICIEVVCNKGDGIWSLDANSLFSKLKDELLNIGLVELKDIEDIFIHREEHAYPIYNIGYKNNLKLVLEYINSFSNLITIGRQGLFKYNNMDHSIEMGFETARYLLGRNDKKQIFAIGTKNEYFG